MAGDGSRRRVDGGVKREEEAIEYMVSLPLIIIVRPFPSVITCWTTGDRPPYSSHNCLTTMYRALIEQQRQ